MVLSLTLQLFNHYLVLDMLFSQSLPPDQGIGADSCSVLEPFLHLDGGPIY